ncbi:MAG: hypothetical protein H7067_06620 [Burkholderiales bacterium]|nr:hypothetical protein [Opitutaceae bacterium]
MTPARKIAAVFPTFAWDTRPTPHTKSAFFEKMYPQKNTDRQKRFGAGPFPVGDCKPRRNTHRIRYRDPHAYTSSDHAWFWCLRKIDA